MTFWEHLEELRGCLWRIVVAVVMGSVAAFCFKEQLFDAVLAPCHSDFITYRIMKAEPFTLHLVNTALAEQMLIHLKMSLAAGLMLASPYVVYVLFGFIAPALHAEERRWGLRLTLAAYAMFAIGLAVNYFMLFPLTVRFLGLYQVSTEVANMLTLSSYTDTLLMMSIAMGVVFEIPVLSWLLALCGLLRAEWMQHFRRHAVVVILIGAAIITPTADAFTLLAVSLPIWLLYELSILIVKTQNKKC